MINSDQRDLAHKEYNDLSQNMRHYANMRFAEMTLFFVVTAALASKVITQAGDIADHSVPQGIIRLLGLIVTLVFWSIEERTTRYWNCFHKRAKVLEADLGFRQYTDEPAPILKRLRATGMVRLMYGLIVLAWLGALVLPLVARLVAL
jgi:hypothetical protein